MLPITPPFEFDKESMIIRNNDMYKHYNKLSLIENRKNIYLPKIKINKFSQNNKNSKRNNLLLFFIEKENEKLNKKINQINLRQNNKSLDERRINDLLKQKKITRENSRKFNLKLLNKKNIEIKNRIKNVHPIINHNKLKLEYLESRKIYDLNRKIKPCFSFGNSCFTQEDYSYMEKYGNKFSENNNKNSNNSSSSKELNKLKKIKIRKLGISLSALNL